MSKFCSASTRTSLVSYLTLIAFNVQVLDKFCQQYSFVRMYMVCPFERKLCGRGGLFFMLYWISFIVNQLLWCIHYIFVLLQISLFLECPSLLHLHLSINIWRNKFWLSSWLFWSVGCNVFRVYSVDYYNNDTTRHGSRNLLSSRIRTINDTCWLTSDKL